MNAIQIASAIEAIDALDLDPIKSKLMHQASGEGWSAAQADAVEIDYRRFLTLMKLYPNESTAPLVDVDTFWHYHILDTAKYAADCASAFGYFLHHYPYLGMDGEEDPARRELAGARMQELVAATFGAGSAHAALKSAAWCGATTAPKDGKDGAATLAWCGKISMHPRQQALAWCGSASPQSRADSLAWCGSATAQAGKSAVAWCGATQERVLQVGQDVTLTITPAC